MASRSSSAACGLSVDRDRGRFSGDPGAVDIPSFDPGYSTSEFARAAPPGVSTVPSVTDFFAGAGGASLGAAAAGFAVEAALDVDTAALTTYEANVGGPTIKHDLTALDPEALSLSAQTAEWFHGSTACQGFSHAKGDRSLADARNQLVRAFLKWVTRCRPRVVTLENVVGMQTISESFMTDLVGAFGSAGYLARWRVLDAADFGVPQRRNRVFVVAVRGDCQPTASEWFPTPTHAPTSTATLDGRELDAHRTATDALAGLPTAATGDAELTSLEAARQRDEGAPPTRPANHIAPDHDPEKMAKYGRYDLGSTNGSVTESRLAPDEPARTMCSSNGTTPLHYREIESGKTRRLTTREVARLQSFPDSFRFVGAKDQQVQQAANAVPPRLQYHIARRVKHLLATMER